MALDRHLSACNECRAVLDQLREVRTRAQRLEDRVPGNELWTGIAARIRADGEQQASREATSTPRERWRVALSVPQLLAAGVALMIVSGGAVQLMHTNRDANVSLAGQSVVETPGVVTAAFDIREYDLIIAELQLVLEERRAALAPATVRTLEHNLAVIDRAIAEATDALAQDPSNEYVAGHLAKTMKQKVRLLQRMVSMPSAAS